MTDQPITGSDQRRGTLREVEAGILRHACQIADERGAAALLVCDNQLNELPEAEHRLLSGRGVILLLAGEGAPGEQTTEGADVIRVPHLPVTREGRIRMGVLLALSHGLLRPGDAVVCLAGAEKSGRLDTVAIIEVAEEFDVLLAPNREDWELSDVRPAVLQRVLELATELALEGREGRSIGALFVIGDIENVLPRTHPMVINPFHGHAPGRRNLLDSKGLGETVKEFSTIDGAVLIRGDGVIESAGAHIDSALLADVQLPPGLGARHRAAAAITGATDCLAVVLSQSTGTVSLLRKGRIVTEIPRPPHPASASIVERAAATNRILVVGGGIGGLSIALRLAEVGLPVTVLEAGAIGGGATLRNQGWLWSGAWLAPQQADTARMCYAALQQTLHFCPECVEPQTESMAYLFSRCETDPRDWTSAWRSLGIAYEPVSRAELSAELPGLAAERVLHAFRLPDRAIRVELLLKRLVVAANRTGVDIRTGTPVVELLREGDSIRGVVTASGEELLGLMVVLATGAATSRLAPSIVAEGASSRRPQFLAVKTHLIAVSPGAGRTPFCVVDGDGFNHVPHGETSLFGLNRWVAASAATDEQVDPDEVRRIWDMIETFFPQQSRESVQTLQWAGTTVQPFAGHLPGQRLLPPTVVDYEREAAPLHNLVSAVAGRATLWPLLAEQTRQVVLAKLNVTPMAAPPWAVLNAQPGG